MNEFAVIKTGGKQYKVSKGDIIAIEKLPGEFKKGDTVIFNEVLLFDDGKSSVIGTPFISNAKVTATFEEAGRYPKIDVIKYKQKSRYFKKHGHRQPFIKVKIESLA
ncbi:50S ribosomal protein L21 [Candidatus Parcubacteria bacterium]|nr:50S ribosomal protein L21 [Candidatus Parcubacteria bacterium]